VFACFLHKHRKKLLSLSLTLLSIAIALFSASLIVSQNNILLYQAVLIIGAVIGFYVMLCIFLPQWIGFPSLIILGAVIVFLSIQVFRYPRIHYYGASSQAVLGTCVVQVDEPRRSTVSFQLIPSQQTEQIQIPYGEQLVLELTLFQSDAFYPLYGGCTWIILQRCKSEAAELSFNDAKLSVFTDETRTARYMATIFGFKLMKVDQFIHLDELGKNIKQKIEWINNSILMRPL